MKQYILPKIAVALLLATAAGCAAPRETLKPTPAQPVQQPQQTTSCLSCTYMQKGRYGDVIRLLSTRTGPLDYKDALNLGTAYLISGYTNNAIYVFKSMLEQYPRDIAVMNNLSVALYTNGLHDVGSSIMQNTAMLSGNIYPIAFNLAQIDTFNDEYSSAAASLAGIASQPISDIGWGVLYLKKKEYGKAVSSLRKALVSFPDNPAVYRGIGMAYAGMGQTVPAINNLKKAVELDRSLIGTFIPLSMLQNSEGNKGHAKNSLYRGIARAEKIKANNLSLYAHYMIEFIKAMYLQADFADSILLINKTLPQIQPLNDKGLNARIYNIAGDDYYALKAFDRAVQAYSYVLEYNPDNEHAYKGTASAYLDMPALPNQPQEQGKIENLQKAVENIKRAISIDPNDASAFIIAGNIYYAYSQHISGEQRTEQFNNAILSYTKASALSPDDYSVQLKLGALYYLADKDKMSIQALNNALRNGASPAEAMPLLAGVYYISGNYATALSEYDLIIKQFPYYCPAYTAKGLILMKTGKKQEAESVLGQSDRCKTR
ncbi:MAG: hypothetical protein M1491_04640 [Deltaproteobacteria bacterium]|nr:hypothetical protein [Deltaproteobacteria bacterium]MCL5276174.1 hypothetical protein [Deltaproteobacteria bacterium]